MYMFLLSAAEVSALRKYFGENRDYTLTEAGLLLQRAAADYPKVGHWENLVMRGRTGGLLLDGDNHTFRPSPLLLSGDAPVAPEPEGRVDEAGFSMPRSEVAARERAEQEADAAARQALPLGHYPDVLRLPPLCSYYRYGITSTVSYRYIELRQLYQVIINPPRYIVELTAKVRGAQTDWQRNAHKQQLDFVVVGGCFAGRRAEHLLFHSGLIVLDFDNLPDVAAARAALLSDKHLRDVLALVFLSPSGRGLKAICRLDPSASFRENFDALSAYLAGTYAALGLAPDKSGSDVTRACFLSHDPDAFFADFA